MPAESHRTPSLFQRSRLWSVAILLGIAPALVSPHGSALAAPAAPPALTEPEVEQLQQTLRLNTLIFESMGELVKQAEAEGLPSAAQWETMLRQSTEKILAEQLRAKGDPAKRRKLSELLDQVRWKNIAQRVTNALKHLRVRGRMIGIGAVIGSETTNLLNMLMPVVAYHLDALYVLPIYYCCVPSVTIGFWTGYATQKAIDRRVAYGHFGSKEDFLEAESYAKANRAALSLSSVNDVLLPLGSKYPETLVAISDSTLLTIGLKRLGIGKGRLDFESLRDQLDKVGYASDLLKALEGAGGRGVPGNLKTAMLLREISNLENPAVLDGIRERFGGRFVRIAGVGPGDPAADELGEWIARTSKARSSAEVLELVREIPRGIPVRSVLAAWRKEILPKLAINLPGITFVEFRRARLLLHQLEGLETRAAFGRWDTGWDQRFRTYLTRSWRIETPVPSFHVQAHRGASAEFLENTVPALSRGFNSGADSVELDVHLTKDGQPVIYHDFVLEPGCCTLPDGSPLKQARVIRDMTLDEVRSLKLLETSSERLHRLDPRSAELAYRIPTLAEALVVAHAHTPEGSREGFLDIEIKSEAAHPELSASPSEMAERVLQEIRNFKMEDRVVVRSFDWRVLDELRARDAKLPIAILTEGKLDDELLAAVERIKASIVAPDASQVTAEGVAKVKALGARVIPWTVNREADVERLRQAGVDGVTTDDPARIAAMAESRGWRPRTEASVNDLSAFAEPARWRDLKAAERRLSALRDELHGEGRASEHLQLRMADLLAQLRPEETRALLSGRGLEALPDRLRERVRGVLSELRSSDESYRAYQDAYDAYQKARSRYLMDQQLADFETLRREVLKSPKPSKKLLALAEKVSANYAQYVANEHQYGLPKDSVTRQIAQRDFTQALHDFTAMAGKLVGTESDPVERSLYSRLRGLAIRAYGGLRAIGLAGKLVPPLVEIGKDMLLTTSQSSPAIGGPMFKAFDVAARHQGVRREPIGLENVPRRAPGEKTINLFAFQHNEAFLDQMGVAELINRKAIERFAVFGAADQFLPAFAADRLDKNDHFVVVGRGSGKPIEKMRQTLRRADPPRDIVIFPEGQVSAGVFEDRPLQDKFSWGLLRALNEEGYKVNIIPVSLPDNFAIEAYLQPWNIEKDRLSRIIVHKPITQDMIDLLRKTGGDLAINRLIRENWMGDQAHDVNRIAGGPKLERIREMLRGFTGLDNGLLSRCPEGFRRLAAPADGR